MSGIDSCRASEPAGQAGPGPLRPQRAARRQHDHRRRPDPGQRADDQGAGRGRRPGGRDRPPRPAEGRAGRDVLAAPRSPSGSASCSAPRSSFATDTVGESATATVAALEDGQVALLENVRFNAGETSKEDEVRAAFADELAKLADALRLRRLRGGPPQAGLGVRRRAAAAARHGTAGRHRDRRAAPADRGPRAPVRRGARRLEGLRQARRDRQPARQGRQAADRRRHGLHLPQGPGPRGGQEPARGGPARDVPRLPRARRGVRRGDRAADRHRGRHRLPLRRPRAGAARRTGRRRSRPTASASTSARSPPRRSPASSPTPAPCSGTARWASSRSTPSPRAPVPSPRR